MARNGSMHPISPIQAGLPAAILYFLTQKPKKCRHVVLVASSLLPFFLSLCLHDVVFASHFGIQFLLGALSDLITLCSHHENEIGSGSSTGFMQAGVAYLGGEDELS